MKYLKTYKLFEAKTSGLTPEQEEFLNSYTRARWTYNPATGLVDVNGVFDFYGKGLNTLSGIKFGKVSKDFRCANNNLTSLKGAPQVVGGDFWCSRNSLKTLKGAPQKVGGSFSCLSNNLTSLEGAPQEVGGSFDCSENNLRSLEGAPQEVSGSFRCYKNNLTSLKGAPQEVGGDFNCETNYGLTSLEGAPQVVGGDFNCLRTNLTSLEGAPQKLDGKFICEAFILDPGEWNPKGWFEVLTEGGPKAQNLILTIFSPEVLNKEIQQDPAGMVMKLKEIWNDESFKETRDKLVWPKGYEGQADLVGDLDEIGF